MKAKTESRTKRLADLEPGDVIVIDKGGHTALVEINEPHSDQTLRARGYYETIFTMADRGPGGWTGHADSMITLATRTEDV
jgi:hypothetical protein